MSCCSPGADLPAHIDSTRDCVPSREEILLASHVVGENLGQTDLSVPAIGRGRRLHDLPRSPGKVARC